MKGLGVQQCSADLQDLLYWTPCTHCLQLSGPIATEAASSSIGCSLMSMELQNNNLTGTLPSTITEDFPRMQTINIAHNHLTGP